MMDMKVFSEDFPRVMTVGRFLPGRKFMWNTFLPFETLLLSKSRYYIIVASCSKLVSMGSSFIVMQKTKFLHMNT